MVIEFQSINLFAIIGNDSTMSSTFWQDTGRKKADIDSAKFGLKRWYGIPDNQLVRRCRKKIKQWKRFLATYWQDTSWCQTKRTSVAYDTWIEKKRECFWAFVESTYCFFSYFFSRRPIYTTQIILSGHCFNTSNVWVDLKFEKVIFFLYFLHLLPFSLPFLFK